MKKNIGLLMIVFLVAIANLNAQDKTEADSDLLGLPGDNLDLYAVLDLFQESKTIEAFEESLNEEKTGINNLDLNADGEVDFIKVVTKKDDDDFAFVLQDDINKDEIQDVAVIYVTKDKDGKVSIQMKGDEDLYGKDYVIEPKSKTSAITANPVYSGSDTVVVKSEPATVVVVESEPIVQYVYSPVYVPYYPPYYYGYYPPYYRPYPVISVNIYFGRNRHHHNHYHGGRHGGGNTVVINNNNNTYNNYSKTRNTSNTVNKNKSEGKYKRNDASNRTSTGTSKDVKNINNKSVPDSKKNATKNNVKDNKTSVPSNKSNVKPATKPSNKPTTRPANKPSGKSKGGGKRR